MQSQKDAVSQKTIRVELESVELLEPGDGFVLSLVDMNQETYRMQLPAWALHQLMRLLPRLDAALLRSRGQLDNALIAYPVARWSIESIGMDDAVALSLQTDRGVESGFLLSSKDASALHAALGDAIHAPSPERPAVEGELDHLREAVHTLQRELSAAESELRDFPAGSPRGDALDRELRGRRILYVGGRPSSTPAIRELVRRHGGEFQQHDGGFKALEALLASTATLADAVVLPVDCTDDDSVGDLQHLCERRRMAFVPLRSASVAAFVAAFADLAHDAALQPPSAAICRHR